MLSLALWCALGVGCGQRSAPSSEASEVIGGAPTTGDVGVVAVELGACSGTLVAERVVLTAAHCLGSGGQTVVLFGDTVDDADRVIVSVATRHPHPDFDAATLDNDIALLTLDSPAPANAIPWPLFAGPLDSSFIGRDVRVVGFGASGSGSGTKRTGTATLDSYTDDRIKLVPGPETPCTGDSGGPAFITIDDVEYLIGVTSTGDEQCSDHAFEARVDVYLESFITPLLDLAVVGSRGFGERCLFADNCASGICVVPDDAPGFSYCSAACSGDDDCDSGMECVDDTCRHPLPSPGALDADCDADADCQLTYCARRSEESGPGVCSVQCSDTLPCPGDRECHAAARGGSACFRPESGGCSVASPGGWLIPLLLALLVLGRARQRRQAWRAARPPLPPCGRG